MTVFAKRLLALTIAMLALLPCGAFAAPSDAAPATPSSFPAQARPALPLEGFVIGIDPGHQLTPDYRLESVSPEEGSALKYRMSGGCQGVLSGAEEYEINRLVSLRLYSLLRQAGAEVLLTRSANDVSLSNMERAQLMNGAGVDFWVRIHCNSSTSMRTCGAMLLLPDEDMEIHADSLRLGRLVLDGFCAATGAAAHPLNETGGQTGFNWSQSPVITIEMGYLSNPEEDLLLCRDSYQSLCALGIYEGITAYCAGGGQ